jgi:hypothetical protein
MQNAKIADFLLTLTILHCKYETGIKLSLKIQSENEYACSKKSIPVTHQRAAYNIHYGNINTRIPACISIQKSLRDIRARRVVPRHCIYSCRNALYHLRKQTVLGRRECRYSRHLFGAAVVQPALLTRLLFKKIEHRSKWEAT